MTNRWLRQEALRAAQATLDLIFPPRCVGCGRFGALLCAMCEGMLEPARGPGRCSYCSARWEGTGNCPRCFGLDALDGVFAAVELVGASRRLVHALKYEGVTAAVPLLAVRMAPLLEAAHADAIFPVPLHRSRRRRRGFNQAELLARALGQGSAPGRLVRIRRSPTQVGRRLQERRSNVAGAFSFEGPPLAGLAVAVIDDVVTTGSTANECAKVLRDHGARRVVAVAFARASYSPTTGEPIQD